MARLDTATMEIVASDTERRAVTERVMSDLDVLRRIANRTPHAVSGTQRDSAGGHRVEQR